MIFKLQSLNDVVTNSSMEVYQEATEYTVEAVKDIINVILKISGSNKTCGDLFTVSIDYDDMYDKYFEDYIDNLGPEDLDEEYLGVIAEKISNKRNNRKPDGYYYTYKELYQELVDMGLVGDVLQTIESYTSNYDCDWGYAETSVSIVPKGECDPRDVVTLSMINNLFNVNASYNS